MSIPRPEHPRPIFQRDNWINLNGEWNFEFDFGSSGRERGYAAATGFDQRITLPFCPESALSGIRYTDFIPAVWYQRVISLPADWAGNDVLLHIGASDFETEVFLDGKSLGRHWGGSTSFTFNLSSQITFGAAHSLVIAASDDLRSGAQTGGKQSIEYKSAGCFYTRTTGIWQTVWLEARPKNGLSDCAITPLFEQNAFLIEPIFAHIERGQKFHVKAFDAGRLAGEALVPAAVSCGVIVPIDQARPWTPESPQLYDFEFRVMTEDSTHDLVRSYGGLRKVHVEGNRLLLNNEPIFLRLVLDQGYYPDGIWTAPREEDLRRDIELGLACGFNGARMHQKVFEPRYLYWADRLGYLTWGESASWGLDLKSDLAARNFLSEWRERVIRDRNHPSLIAWTPLNETWDLSNEKQHDKLHREVYELTKALDRHRPVNEASGGAHVCTDLYTVHIYEQDPEKLYELLDPDGPEGVFRTLGDREAPYEGQPYIVDEFGGIRIMPEYAREVADSWGYGESPHSIADFYERLRGQVHALLRRPHVSGYCYTQLTDVEQEQNGLFYYDRSHKFDLKIIREIFSCVRPMSQIISGSSPVGVKFP